MKPGDRSERPLEDFPRPSVAVDTAVLTVAPDDEGVLRLDVLQMRNDRGHAAGTWSLPGTFLHEGELLEDAVRRSLKDKVGLTGRHPIQLYVFDDPDRDDRGRVLSVAHIDVLTFQQIAELLAGRDDLRLRPAERPGRMPYDHGEIVKRAVAHMRQRYETAPDPDGLLPGRFTLRQLRLVHEAVAGRRLQRDTFRRSVEDQLVPTGQMTEGERGRPAELFKKRSRSTR